VNSSVLSLDLKVPEVLLADLMFTAESLLQRVGATTGKERDKNAAVAGG